MSFLDLFRSPACPYCGSTIERGMEACASCRSALDVKPRFLTLENGVKCCSILPYRKKARKTVLYYKYYGHREYAKPMALTMARYIQQYLSDVPFDFYMSVPCCRKQPKGRFDQVTPLAKHAAKKNGAAYMQPMMKSPNTKMQKNLNAEQRRKNIVNAYYLKEKANVSGMHILLFDDVMTTGSTLLACSNKLLEGGAASVTCITFAY